MMRNHLMRCASVGELEPDDVERIGRSFGLEPFGRTPDPAEYDPMAEVQWTLPMAISWIAYRTADAVREAWPQYVGDCWDWEWHRYRIGPDGPIREGWRLEQRKYRSVLRLELEDLLESSSDGAVKMSFKGARKALWMALAEGMLPATGVSRLGGGRKDIPSTEWIALQPKESNYRDEVGREGVSMDYADPLVPAKAVQLFWGPPKPKLTLPALMRPEGDGYMPLFCAAQWIATKGGSREFDPEEGAIWQEAYGELLRAIASERIGVVGTKDGQKEPVPGYLFADCEVDYPFDSASLEVMMGKDIYLRSYPYVDETHWRRGFDDALVARRGDLWTQLMVLKNDVQERWPFGFDVASFKSGLPGRPTSRHLLFEEMERRAKTGELSDKLRDEARHLSGFLADKHPGAHQALPKSIEQSIRTRFWELKKG